MHARTSRLLPALGLALLAACHSDKFTGIHDTPLPASLVVGDLVRVNVNGKDDCFNGIYHVARVVAIGDKSMVLADTLNPTGGFTTADYQRYAAKFDTLIYPLDAGAFGEPTDIDNNGRVGIIFTRAVNELTPANSSQYIGGFTFSRDLFPVVANSRADACATSNQGEFFYALAPDPLGTINNNKRTTGFVDSATVPVLAHELQHLINASRKIYINTAADSLEAGWLDEGLAHMAEELLFYRESATAPRTNLTVGAIQARRAIVNAFNEDMSGNAGRYRSYLLNPSANSPYALNDDLSTRGAAWDWLRYLADEKMKGVTRNPGAATELLGPGTTSVAGGTAGGDYTAILVNGSAVDLANVNYVITAGSVIAPLGSLSPLTAATLSRSGDLASTGPALTRDAAFEARLRTRERAMAPTRLATARAWYTNEIGHVEMPQGGRFSVAPTPIASPDGDIWFRLANGTVRGLKNLQAVFGMDPAVALGDWSASNWLDDSSALVPDQFQQPSWNWRDIYPTLYGGFPLPARTMVAGTPLSGTIVPGGSAYFRFGVAPSASASITVSSSDAAAPSLRLLIVRTR